MPGGRGRSGRSGFERLVAALVRQPGNPVGTEAWRSPLLHRRGVRLVEGESQRHRRHPLPRVHDRSHRPRDRAMACHPAAIDRDARRALAVWSFSIKPRSPSLSGRGQRYARRCPPHACRGVRRSVSAISNEATVLLMLTLGPPVSRVSTANIRAQPEHAWAHLARRDWCFSAPAKLRRQLATWVSAVRG